MKGFTLIELMISVTILTLLLGIGTVSLNDFNANQKVQAAKNELISNLKFARNYATTMQLPVGVTGQMSYVEVGISNGIITAATNIGSTYFSKIFSTDGIGIGVSYSDNSRQYIRFASYKGNSLGGNIKITINSNEKVGSSAVVEINDSGLINEKQ
jgi:type IV fimbrial biogenesis protein FimT